MQLLIEFGCLCDLIEQVQLSQQPDTFSWGLTMDQNILLGSSTPIGAKQVWKTAAPPRVRFFFWLVMHGRCWTAERRFRHGLQDSPVCIMCDQQDETMDHILLGCSFSREGGTFGCINCICRTPSLLPKNTRSSGGCEAGS